MRVGVKLSSVSLSESLSSSSSSSSGSKIALMASYIVFSLMYAAPQIKSPTSLSAFSGFVSGLKKERAKVRTASLISLNEKELLTMHIRSTGITGRPSTVAGGYDKNVLLSLGSQMGSRVWGSMGTVGGCPCEVRLAMYWYGLGNQQCSTPPGCGAAVVVVG